GLGWNDLHQAVERYGVIQHWVREVETPAKKGGRGQTEIRESTVPAPGVSAKLLPHLLHELVFLTVLDVGAHMPPRIEIPDIIPMADPELSARVEAARALLAAAERRYHETRRVCEAVTIEPNADEETMSDTVDTEAGAHDSLLAARAEVQQVQEWAQ